jgi:hypothetical protein
VKFVTTNCRCGVHTGKVIQDAERHDTETMFRSEVLVGVANIFPLVDVVVENLDIRSDILITPVASQFSEGLRCHFRLIQLMVTYIIPQYRIRLILWLDRLTVLVLTDGK